MKNFHLCYWLLSYDLPMISVKLAISLKYNLLFAKFNDILLDNSVTSSFTRMLMKQTSFGSHLSLYFQIFYLRLYLTKLILKMQLKNSARLGFRLLTKSLSFMIEVSAVVLRCLFMFICTGKLSEIPMNI